MARKIYYLYNPETDNFERAFPSLGERMRRVSLFLVLACVAGGALFLIAWHGLASPDERSLRAENSRLKAQCNIVERRLDNALKAMADIQHRDDNFYRVMLQMEPFNSSQRVAGLDNENRYKKLSTMSDEQLVGQLNRNMDLLERQLYAQSQSFNQLRDAFGRQKEKFAHIPSVAPLASPDFTIAAGFGFRRDPVYGFSKFHEGLDLVAPEGTPVHATADGVVTTAERRAVFGNIVELDHGYNYQTRFAHLRTINVSKGQQVRRGDMIGTLGNSGQSVGPHLHYEVIFKDVAENPVNYFFLGLSPEKYDEMVTLAENAASLMD